MLPRTAAWSCWKAISGRPLGGVVSGARDGDHASLSSRVCDADSRRVWRRLIESLPRGTDLAMAVIRPGDHDAQGVEQRQARGERRNSTLGGSVGGTRRSTNPSRSRSRSVWVSIRFQMSGTALRRALKRRGPPASAMTRSELHLSPIRSSTSLAARGPGGRGCLCRTGQDQGRYQEQRVSCRAGVGPEGSEELRPKVARFRARWRAHQHRLDPRRLVFIDVEAGSEIVPVERFPRRGWIKSNMTRGTAHVAHGHWKTLTFLAGCAMTGSSFPSCWTVRSTARCLPLDQANAGLGGAAGRLQALMTGSLRAGSWLCGPAPV